MGYRRYSEPGEPGAPVEPAEPADPREPMGAEGAERAEPAEKQFNYTAGRDGISKFVYQTQSPCVMVFRAGLPNAEPLCNGFPNWFTKRRTLV